MDILYEYGFYETHVLINSLTHALLRVKLFFMKHKKNVKIVGICLLMSLNPTN